MDVIKGKWAAVSAPTRAAPPSFSRSVGDLDLICPIFVAAVQFYVDKIVSDGGSSPSSGAACGGSVLGARRKEGARLDPGGPSGGARA